MNALNGVKVVSSSLAIELTHEFRIEKHPIQKRRKQWRIVKHHIEIPKAFMINGICYMYPLLIEKLKAATVTEVA